MNPLNEKSCLFFAIVFTLHIGLGLAVSFAPDFTKKKPKFEHIYTVELIESRAPAPKQQIKTPTKPIKKDVISTSAVKSKSIVPISIKPKKKKVIKKTTPQKDNSEEKDRRKRQQDRLKKALADEKRAQDIADEAQRILEEELRLLSEASTPKNTPPRQTTSNNNRGSNTSSNSGSFSIIEAQWLAKVNSHLLEFWSLPSLKDWDHSTKAVIIIEINNNGRILNSFFEKSSGDKIFDNFVKKSLQDASPLPAIPSAMNKKRFELGLKYTPNNIQ